MPATRDVPRLFVTALIALTLLTSAPVLFAQPPAVLLPGMRYEPILPRPGEVPSISGSVSAPRGESELSKAVIVEELKGLVFVDASKKIKLIAPEIQGIETQADHPLLLTQDPCFRATLQQYLNRRFTAADLKAMQKAITEFYRANDMPVVGVLVPDQDVSSGTVQVVILEARVNRMDFRGNRYTCSDRLAAQMETEPGSYICASRLNEDLYWLNRTDFRAVTVKLNPAEEEGFVNLDFDVKEDFPIRSAIQYADNGTRSLGIERLQFGMTYGNVFGLGPQVSYGYNATPDFERVQVHTYSFNMPCENRDILSIYGYKGNFVSPLPEPFASDGESWQLSLRYQVLLDVDRTEDSRRERRFTCGVDAKETNSNLDFGGFRVSSAFPQVAQFAFGYVDSYINSKKGALGFQTELFWSPGDLLAGNNTQEFQLLRYGTQADYAYATTTGSMVRFLGERWQWNVVGRGQWSSARLLPIEEMGLGGDDSVRGFDTYALIGDAGWSVSNELATRYKRIGVDRYLRRTCVYDSVRTEKDEFQAFAFFDIGAVWIRDAQPGLLEKSYQSICGTGVGCRYNFGPWVRVRAAYGWQVDGLDNSVDDRRGRPHILVVIAR